MEEKHTEKQVLEFTVNILSNISIPAALVESIGIPVSKAIGNLLALLEAKKEVKKDDGREVNAE